MWQKNKKYKMNLRRYMMLVSITTLVFSFIISALIVFLGVKMFFYGKMTHVVLVVGGFVFCVLVITIDAFLFWSGSEHLITPLLKVNDAVTQVAKGNFKVQIKRQEVTEANYQYFNEIDELSKNVNKMVKELDGMEYMRKDFMRNVSHEVKTPIAAITGFSELLLDRKLTEEEQIEYLDIINKESMRISRLCQNMLSMAMLDNQVIVAENKQIQLDEQIRKSVIVLSEKWSEKEIDFNIELESIVIESDPDMLQQVWINLIDNAIKYSGEKSTIDILAKEQDNYMVEVVIKDHGKGISQEKIPKIFDMFYQCDESHKNCGNGLGLSIVQRIIELLHGTIVCESEEEIGTTMKVRLQKKKGH